MRPEGWPERLYEYIQSRTTTPFSWGGNDCCTFAAGGVEAIMGESPFTATYTNEFEANTFMDSVGGIEAWLNERFGASIPRLQANRGDIVMIQLPDRQLLGLCMGTTVCAPGPDGLLYYPLDLVLKAWRVE